MADLTDNFSRAEVSRSDTAERLGLDNTPSPEHFENAHRLAVQVLEPVRLLLGDRPIHVNSWYRSPVLNRLTPGSSPTSAHMAALACDFRPMGVDVPVAYEAIRRSGLVWDQLIWERSWIHIALAAFGHENRREAFRIP